MNSNIGYTTEMIGGVPVVVAPAEIDIATAAAHRRAVADGGELITPAGSSVFHVLTLAGMYRLIPTFGDLEEALVEGLPLLSCHRFPAGIRDALLRVLP